MSKPNHWPRQSSPGNPITSFTLPLYCPKGKFVLRFLRVSLPQCPRYSSCVIDSGFSATRRRPLLAQPCRAGRAPTCSSQQHQGCLSGIYYDRRRQIRQGRRQRDWGRSAPGNPALPFSAQTGTTVLDVSSGACCERVPQALCESAGRTMRYQVQFKPRAVKDIEGLPVRTRSRILAKVEEMGDDLKGDVKRLTSFTQEYRLRVGNYRVLFEVEGESIVVYRVRHRREAYR